MLSLFLSTMASFRTEGVTIVTDFAGVNGLGAANALAEAGAWAVIFTDIDGSRVSKAAEESKYATNAAYQSRAYALDVTDAYAVEAVFGKVVGEFGKIDYLVNSAGIDTAQYVAAPANDMNDYDRVLDKQEPRSLVSKTGMKRDLGRGAIVNVTSLLSYAGVQGKVVYVASKHAALGITKALALDTTADGIRVNLLAPGHTRTPMFEGKCKKTPQVMDFIKAAVPAGRPLEPEEVGEGVVYLCSPMAGYVNGIGLIMDSGLSLTVHVG
ncbi:NAD(P)-binding protein [Lentithecium fluviatile CBS 122367]|uniref:NAD(P)-binding protein n=1 Tax=Lentithecium fluviatile CBS 122367 TaxID=1168545 RepID=A0A6G1IDK8_9PLEO|nr:NAD(P)-binding protein [Lentithecium fluviatile CBS 122367]